MKFLFLCIIYGRTIGTIFWNIIIIGIVLNIINIHVNILIFYVINYCIFNIINNILISYECIYAKLLIAILTDRAPYKYLCYY